jgi:hypothetical protein
MLGPGHRFRFSSVRLQQPVPRAAHIHAGLIPGSRQLGGFNGESAVDPGCRYLITLINKSG